MGSSLCGSVPPSPSGHAHANLVGMKKIAAFCLFSLLITACSQPVAPGDPSQIAESPSGIASAPVSDCTSRAYPDIGGPITLTDQTGRAVTEADFKGGPSLVFFGFTFCPDVCPSTLVRLKRAFALLPDGMPPPRVILISVDPARDTPEKLKLYAETKAFPENMVALSGSEAAIKAAADEFLASYSRIEQPESAAGYTMDHSSLIYLMDETWTLKTFFTASDQPETIAACLSDILEPGP
jgi:protein SCO1